MECNASHLPFQQTGFFSKIITDYLEGVPALVPFYEHPVSSEGLQSAIRARQQFKTPRAVLVETLREQYASLDMGEAVRKNMDRLLEENTFTFTTAHQPALFTGTLYFIYKILHVIKLAAHYSEQWPQFHFVPVFYMGSEDADLEELGKIFLHHEKMIWETDQRGAVGRMRPTGLEKMINRIEGELSVEPYGEELIFMLRESFLESPDIQTATFKLIHRLFGKYGLIVLIPDHANLKKEMVPVFEDDLMMERPSELVATTIQELSKYYKVQANPRTINLFYLHNDLRGRIERIQDKFIVHDSDFIFTKETLLEELYAHPERFSPNVILRGLLQETVLPNIAFIGGGGETAYWLELLSMFRHYRVPYPVLILRNSYLLIEKKWENKISNAGLTIPNLFKGEEMLFNEWVKQNSHSQLSLDKEKRELGLIYDQIKHHAAEIDPTLKGHVESMMSKALKPVAELEKKILRAEKRKFADRRRQIHALKAELFPLNSLQERIENFMPFYAKSGNAFLDLLYTHARLLEQDFTILSGF